MGKRSGSLSPSNRRPDSQVASGAQRRSGVNGAFTPQGRETWDRAGGIIRCINAMARSFREGNEDTNSLDSVKAIEEAVGNLRAAALEGLHGYYSNRDIAASLGVSRQAVSQARRRTTGKR